MILTNPLILPALAALILASVIVLITAHARNRAASRGISERNLDFMARMGAQNGWGKSRIEYRNRHGTDEVYRFVPFHLASQEDQERALRVLRNVKTDKPTVFLVTCYHDKVRYNPDGTLKELGKDARTFQAVDDDD
jgi:hypothetical protein